MFVVFTVLMLAMVMLVVMGFAVVMLVIMVAMGVRVMLVVMIFRPLVIFVSNVNLTAVLRKGIANSRTGNHPNNDIFAGGSLCIHAGEASQ